MQNVTNINDTIIHFGLDHLEVFGTFKYEKDLFESLDFDNSNYGELEQYTFTKNEVPKFLYKIIFSKDNYSLFAYYKGDSRLTVPTKDYIVVYSTAFKLLEYEEVVGFLEFYFDLKHNRRFDIALDTTVPITELLATFGDLETGREYKKQGEVETRYIGEVKNSLNKRQLIRIYNKQKDIVVKKKLKLYADYFDYPNVTRVEIEVRSELAKNRTYQDLFDNSLLVGIFKNYLYKHCKLFDSLDGDKVTLFRKQEEIDPEKFQALYYKTQRKKIFLGHARSVFNLGYCPLRILIGEKLYQEKTSKIIGQNTLDTIEQLEKDFRKDERVMEATSKKFRDLLSHIDEYE